MKIELKRYSLAIISIALIVFGVYSSVIQYADAVILRSRVFHTSIANQGFTYYNQLDAIVHVSDSPNEMQLMSGSTLAGISNITLQIGASLAPTGNFADIVTCGFFLAKHRCFYAVQPTGASVIIATQDIQTPFDFTIYVNTTLAGCAVKSYTQASGNVYAVVQDSGGALCSGSEIGTWIISVGALFDGISSNDNQIIARPVGLQGKFIGTTNFYDSICYDDTTKKIVVSGDNAIIRIDTLTNTYNADISMASPANLITDIFCANGFAIVTSSSGAYIKVVNLSTGTVVTTSLSATSVIKHGSDIYITNSSSRITILSYSTSSSMSASGTISPISVSSQKLMKANATRFNVITATEFIYAVDGLPNDGSGVVAPFACVNIDTSPIIGFVSILTLCDTDGDGIIDTTQEQVPRVTQNITTSTKDIFCIIGLTDCTNTNVKTNGVGIMLLLLLILLTITIVMAVTMKTQHEVTEIHPLLWLTLMFVDVAGAWYFKWIEDIIFYGLVVVFIGLGAFGVYRHIKGEG